MRAARAVKTAFLVFPVVNSRLGDVELRGQHTVGLRTGLDELALSRKQSRIRMKVHWVGYLSWSLEILLNVSSFFLLPFSFWWDSTPTELLRLGAAF